MVEKNKIEISIVILCYRSNEQIIQFIEKIKSELEKGRIGYSMNRKNISQRYLFRKDFFWEVKEWFVR